MEYALQFNSGFCHLISLLLYVFFYFKVFKKYNLKGLGLVSIFWLYITEIINICFFPISANYSDVINNANLLSHYDKLYNLEININYFDKYLGVQHILNVIMMIPFGILLPYIRKSNTVFQNILICLFIPISIELLQFILTNILHITIHFFDVNDLINNFFGAIIGLSIYYLLKTIFKNAIKH